METPSLLPAQHPSPYPITHDSVNCTTKNMSAQPWYSIACRKHQLQTLGKHRIPSKTRDSPPALAFTSQQEKPTQFPAWSDIPGLWAGWGSPLASPPASALSSSLLEKAGNESHRPEESGEASPSWLLSRTGSLWNSFTANHNTQTAHPTGAVTSGEAADRAAQGSLDFREGLFSRDFGGFGASGVLGPVLGSATDMESPEGSPRSCRDWSISLRRARSRLRDLTQGAEE